jgi:hypothetical protein
MLGWHASVYRQPDGGHSPATFESPEGERLAVWQHPAPVRSKSPGTNRAMGKQILGLWASDRLLAHPMQRLVLLNDIKTI